MGEKSYYDVIVIGGGHAGAEAAWAAANLGAEVALVTMDPAKIGAMSCNPAIGGLAKGQMVCEIDALGGLMGLAADATGIQFRMLNASKGPAVRGPRCQSDKYAYAREVQRLIALRENITVIAGTVDQFIRSDEGNCTGIVFMPNPKFLAGPSGEETAREIEDGQLMGADCCATESYSGPRGCDSSISPTRINAKAIVLTTGTFMRGLMHTGESQTPGGRVGEAPANIVSDALREMGFELGRLKTGTPPRLAAESLRLDELQEQPGDDEPIPFSQMTRAASDEPIYAKLAETFPVLPQRPCWVTHTNEQSHELIRANLGRAPIYNGQIATAGPRYCPSIEDKVVRFADRHSHHVFLEPESLKTNEIYCNGISTSLPADVQDVIVRNLPGCEDAKILKYGYAVEYDMVWPHQIDATCMTKLVPGLFLAGQINGTSGYEEAGGQGLIAGLNAVRFRRGQPLVRLDRDQAYIGVLMDDLVTKTPREPYRMFTSRAEYRILLRADNAPDRLTPLGRELGLVDDARWARYQQRRAAEDALHAYMKANRTPAGKAGELKLSDWAKRPEVDAAALLGAIDATGDGLDATARDPRIISKVLADIQYAGYERRIRDDVGRLASQEHKRLPESLDYDNVTGLRREAQHTLAKFRPATFGQASRLAGITPADLMVLSVTLGK